MLPKDYIRYRLTGVLATEPSDASATLMYDTATLRGARDSRPWAVESIVPDVGGSATCSAASRIAARSRGLRSGLPVVGGGRTTRAGRGRGRRRAGRGVASWGTSGTVLAPMASRVSIRARAHTFCHVVPDCGI
jgi:xylulokinase